MSRYDDLKEPQYPAYYGSRYRSEFSQFLDGIMVQGFLDCPECNETLEWDFITGLWHCKDCHHGWDSESLISILEHERKEDGMAEQLKKEEMDANAAEAEAELLRDNTTYELDLLYVAQWWKKHYQKCGHKRLGRILLKYADIEEE